MKLLTTLLFTSLLITACKNNSDKNAGSIDKNISNSKDSTTNNEAKKFASKRGSKNDNSSHSWTRKEQNKFLQDCEKGSDQQLTGKKLKDFCTCMLIQAQKYYSSYNEMDEKSDEDSDKKILESCAGYAGDDEN